MVGAERERGVGPQIPVDQKNLRGPTVAVNLNDWAEQTCGNQPFQRKQ